MPSDVPPSLNLAFYVLVIWGLSSVLGAFRFLAQSERSGLLLRGFLFAWLGVPVLLAISGRLARFDVVPPPLMPIVGLMAFLVVIFAFSPLGRQTADRLPESLLVGVQGFRFPLELVLYGLAARKVLPLEMTFLGYNYDIITGVAALALWRLVRRGRAPRWSLWLWNVVGLVLLGVIVALATVSAPLPFGWFEPQNRLVAFYPWVLLPTFLVQVALLSHLLLFRKLAGGGGQLSVDA